MMFQTGDLVRIQSGYACAEGNEFDWVGMILSYRGLGLGDEREWFVQWAHQPHEAVEFEYYLELI